MKLNVPTILERTAIAAIILAAVAECLSPLMVPTLGYDGFHALMWIDGFPAVMRDGVWYPHWLPNAYGGLGSATFYFYPPLAFFIESPIRLLLASLSATTIYHITGFVVTLASFFSMRYLLQSLSASAKYVILGALLYAFAPYHFEVLYTRSGPAEHLAFVWTPLVFAGLFQLLNRTHSRAHGFALLAVSWGLLLISHVPAAVTIGIGVASICAFSFGRTGWRRMSLVLLSLVLGTGLAAFYLVPVQYFSTFAQLQYLRVTHAGLEDPFVALLDVIHGNNFTVKGIALVHFGVLTVMVLALSYLWRKKGGSDPLVLSLLAAGIADLFFQTAGISRPIWNLLHLTQVIQFAWRWNILASVIAAIVFAKMDDARTRPWISASVAALALTALFFTLTTNLDFRVHPRDPQRTPFDPPEYAPIFADSIKENVVAFALAHEHDALVSDSSGAPLNYQIRSTASTSLRVLLNLPHSETIVLHHWYWPTWKLREVTTEKEIVQHPDTSGRAVAMLPAGDHDLEYALETSPAEKMGNVISILSLLLIAGSTILLSLRGVSSGRRSNPDP